jgi:hypothetical protein
MDEWPAYKPYVWRSSSLIPCTLFRCPATRTFHLSLSASVLARSNSRSQSARYPCSVVSDPLRRSKSDISNLPLQRRGKVLQRCPVLDYPPNRGRSSVVFHGQIITAQGIGNHYTATEPIPLDQGERRRPVSAQLLRPRPPFNRTWVTPLGATYPQLNLLRSPVLPQPLLDDSGGWRWRPRIVRKASSYGRPRSGGIRALTLPPDDIADYLGHEQFKRRRGVWLTVGPVNKRCEHQGRATR